MATPPNNNQTNNPAVSTASSQLDLLKQINKFLEQQKEHSKGISDNLNGQIDATKELNENLQESSNLFEKIASTSGTLLKALMVAAPFAALAKGFQIVSGAASVAFGAIKGVVSGIFGIGKAIIAIPFSIFNSLVSITDDMMSGTSVWRQTVEEIRKEYGALSQTVPTALMSIGKSLRGVLREAGAGRIFATAGDALKAAADLAKEMGPIFGIFSKEMEKSEGRLIGIQMGLGLAAKDMKILGSVAISTGTSLEKQLLDIEKQSSGLGAAFNVETKLIARDIAEAMANVGQFGGATIKELGVASVYARKLGLELKDIAGTLSAFETFDTAAQNVSKLSQAFGVQVDAFKLMEAQDPAKQIDLLRKGFAQAGVDVSSFNRQQLKLLSTSTGLTEEQARQAFSLKNQGVSMDELNKKADENEKKQLNQVEVLKKLADAIEKLVESGSTQKGFFEKFIEGFDIGIKRSGPFRSIIRNLAADMRILRAEGIRLGGSFVEFFPGVKDIFEGFAEIMDPKNFKPFVSNVVNDIIKFFKEFAAGGMTFSDLMENITGSFEKFANSGSAGASKLIGGLKTFFSVINAIAKQVWDWLKEKVKEGFFAIVDLVKSTDWSSVGSSIGGFLKDSVFGYIATDLWENVAPALGASIMKLGEETILPFLKNVFENHIKPFFVEYGPTLLALLFGPAALLVVAPLLVKGAAKLVGSLKDLITCGKAAESAKTPTEAMPKVIPPADDVQNKGRNLSAGKLAGIMAAIAVFLAALVGITALLIEVAKSAEGVSLGSIVKTLLVLASLAVVAGGIALLLGSLEKAKISGKALTGLLIIGVALTVLLLAVWGIIAIAKEIPKDAESKISVFSQVLDVILGNLLGLVGVLFAAVGLGVLASSFFGLGAVLMIAGFAMITMAIKEISSVIFDIMNQIDAIPISSSDFAQKALVFSEIMKAVMDFAKIFASILDSLKPIIEEIDDADEMEKFSSILLNVSNMVEKMTAGIVSVLNIIKEMLSQISLDANFVQNGKALAEIFSGVSNLLMALQPPDFLREAISKFDDDEEEISLIMLTFSMVMDRYIRKFTEKDGVFDKIQLAVEAILKKASSLKDLGSPEQIGAFASLFSSIANIITGFQLKPDVLAKFVNFSESKDGDESSTTGSFNETKFLDVLRSQFNKIDLLILTVFSMTNDLLNNPNFKSLDKNSVESIKAIVSIFDVIVQLVKVFNDIKSKLPDINIAQESSLFGEGSNAIGNITVNSESLSELLDKISKSDVFKSLFGKIVEAVNTIPTTSDFKEKITSAKNLFSFIKEVAGLMKTLKEIFGDSGSMSVDFAGPMEQVVTFLEKLSKDNLLTRLFTAGVTIFGIMNTKLKDAKGKDTKQTQGDAISAVGGIFNTVKGIAETLVTFGDKADESLGKKLSGLIGKDENNPITKLFSNTGTIIENLQSSITGGFVQKILAFNTNAKEVKLDGALKELDKTMSSSKNLIENNLLGSVAAFSELLDAMSELNTKISAAGTDPIIMSAALKKAADGLGLEHNLKNQNFKISAGAVQVNLNLTVKMDAGEVEEVILQRQKSFIGAWINKFSTEPVMQETSPPVKLNIPLAQPAKNAPQ